jgi:hypothetical protein
MKILLTVDSHCILHLAPLPEDKPKLLRMLNCYRDGEFFEMDMADYDIQIKSLFMGDSKPYWRTYKDPNYKANRKKRSLAFSKLLQLREYQDSLYAESFEFDDLIGLIWRMWPKLRYEFDFWINITIDSDHMQILTCPDIGIVDIKGYLPPFRSHKTCWLWVSNQLKSVRTTKKNKAELETIIETLDKDDPGYWSNVIRTYKHRCGDKVDNIPPMAPEYMTNLLDSPPDDFGLLLDTYKPVIQKLLNEQEFRPAKLCSQYVEDCIIGDHVRVPLLDRRNWEAMELSKHVRKDLLSFMY